MEMAAETAAYLGLARLRRSLQRTVIAEQLSRGAALPASESTLRKYNLRRQKNWFAMMKFRRITTSDSRLGGRQAAGTSQLITLLLLFKLRLHSKCVAE